jgi:ionotropic glutamate receptor NMDA 3A
LDKFIKIVNFKLYRNGSLDVYISDQILLNYMRFKETNCNLKITGENFAETGYAFGLGNEMSVSEKSEIDIQILDYFETGFLDELYNKWFNKRVKCNKKGSDDKIRIDVDQYKGVWAYLGIGILAAVVVLFLEQALYKWTIPFLRSKPKISNWKSLKLMFISQVSLEKCSLQDRTVLI